MSLLNYIAILGRQPEFGLVELESILGPAGVRPFGRQAALISQSLGIERLGGSVKLGLILYRGPVTSLRELPFDIGKLARHDSKTTFAISAYGVRETARDLVAAGLELKKQLKREGPVRLITPAKGLAVSAAELKHNRVLSEGFELLFVQSGSELIIARTTGVQDIDWYSKRDYERPARSAKVGMLPPKLAQIMVNTTRGKLVADPFCGTGVVLQEARLLGRRAVGSDLSEEMVAATRENSVWLGAQVPTSLPDWSVTQADAREVELPTGCSVVSEGYLGPNQSKAPSESELAAIKRELLSLYRDALINFGKQLPAGGEVTICVPAWRLGKRWDYLGLVDELPKLGYTPKGFRAASASPLLYARDDQIVGRQLLILRKN
jgi:tRNA (guanine10-N2)-dimethyltransferase